MESHKIDATGRQEAEAATRANNAAVQQQLPFSDRSDFERVRRGFIATIPELIIRGEDGHTVWDMEQYGFIAGTAPETVNPSLWRQAQLNQVHGLFQVAERIYQVRGFDLANITFIEGDSGRIVIDPLTSAETAQAALRLANQHLGQREIKAVIYTHSHIDHFAGARGVVSGEEVSSGQVRIIAPEGFLEAAVSENVIAGNVISRRAAYMYGNLLPKDPQGQVDTGLGKTVSTGSFTLIAPTETIGKTGTEAVIDGVRLVFQFTPDTEAPAEMNIYFPEFKALCIAENCTANLHNVYTLRGAQVRDALAWSKYINEALELFAGEAEVVFASHHWPRWGSEIIDYLKKQRDLYRFIHDQTMRLANQGYTMLEIAEMMELPETLAHEFYARGYYGSLSHDVKAVYQKYIGWFDGNPANLQPLPPAEAGERYVEYMGGAEAVLARAQEAYERGEYRWVAQVVNHVVFTDPDNKAARELQADALEQLGYQAEAGPWRNFYLTGAQELRQGLVQTVPAASMSADVIRALPIEMLFDLISVRLNGSKAAGWVIRLNLSLTDTDQKYILSLENSAISYVAGRLAEDADASLSLSRQVLDQLIADPAGFESQVMAGEVAFSGDPSKLTALFSLLDQFDVMFNIVTP